MSSGTTFSRIAGAIKRLIRVGRISLGAQGDASPMPVQQVSYLGKTGDAFMAFPYGLHANVPPAYLALLFAQDGKPEARLAYPMSPKQRPLALPEGEFVVYNPVTKTEVRFLANGDLAVTTKTGQSIFINALDMTLTLLGNFLANVTGNLTANATGAVVIAAQGNATVSSPQTITLGGNVVVTGTLTVNGVEVGAHVHDENGSGGGTTDPPKNP